MVDYIAKQLQAAEATNESDSTNLMSGTASIDEKLHPEVKFLRKFKQIFEEPTLWTLGRDFIRWQIGKSKRNEGEIPGAHMFLLTISEHAFMFIQRLLFQLSSMAPWHDPHGQCWHLCEFHGNVLCNVGFHIDSETEEIFYKVMWRFPVDGHAYSSIAFKAESFATDNDVPLEIPLAAGQVCECTMLHAYHAWRLLCLARTALLKYVTRCVPVSTFVIAHCRDI